MSKLKITYKTTVEIDLDLKKIHDYLIEHGWEDRATFMRFGRLFVNDKEACVVLPTTDKVGDWELRMNEFIHELAEAEGRPIPEVIRDLE
jgi:hypothetical protein